VKVSRRRQSIGDEGKVPSLTYSLQKEKMSAGKKQIEGRKRGGVGEKEGIGAIRTRVSNHHLFHKMGSTSDRGK